MRIALSFVRAASFAFLTSLFVLPPRAASAQGADATKVVTPALDFSGVFFGDFAYQYDDATKNANGGNATNKFDVGRVYLNFRMPAGNDGSIRVTPDIFQGDQSSASYYKGWTVRMKYAYFQYNYLHDIGGSKGFDATARLGMTQTALVEFEESFWPRSISLTAVERNGFFASSDVGVSTIVTLPGKWGEIHATIMNGANYSSGENDPYKDYAARLTLTPFGTWFLRAMGMRMGRRPRITTEFISDPCMITLGDDVAIGGSAHLFCHYGGAGHLVIAPLVIGSRATIGLKATVMGDVVVGEDATVLAHSVLLPGTRV